jgi:hypothetical protein
MLAALFAHAASLPVRADGAFPDADTILVAADHPREIILVTNFGLISSQDEGRSWTWSCEQTGNAFGTYYQISLPPRHRIFTVADMRVMFSDDASCGWTAAQGLIADQAVTDVWVDRRLPDRVLAVGTEDQMIHTVIESMDGGTSFDVIRYQAAPGRSISGLETALTDPSTIYLTAWGEGLPPAPVLVRSTDGGLSWEENDLTGQLGLGTLRLVAVDVADPARVFLLWQGAEGSALAVTHDGGVTVAKTLIPQGVIRAFVQTPVGTILVASELERVPTLYRSRDSGRTFEVIPGPPHVRGLAERAGTIYAATDNFVDGFAIATSRDDGNTWHPLLVYADVAAIVQCVKDACQESCQRQASLTVWPDTVCFASPRADAGPDAPDARSDGEADGTSGSGGGGGCGCEIAATGRGRGLWAAALAAWLVALRGRRRKTTGCRADICFIRPPPSAAARRTPR